MFCWYVSDGYFTHFKQISRKDLLALDFEGVLKYFRVQLPKRFRTEEATKELIQTAVGLKVSSKKLKKYEKEYQSIREQSQQEDPIERMEVSIVVERVEGRAITGLLRTVKFLY